MYDKLFEPVNIGTLTLKNRLIVPPLSTLAADENGAPTEQLIAYLERKAQGGWGMITTEYYGVAPHVGYFKRMLGIWNDDLVEKNKELTKRVHAAGAKIAAQINHSGRETWTGITDKNLVAPSPYRDVYQDERPHELTIPEIHQIVSQYGDTALNLKRAGFDAVEVYGAHGYLVSEFLSKYSNKRTDEYGGSLENRMRFLLEIIADIRKKVGPDFPVMVRISTKEFVPNGLSIAESRVIATRLEQAGVNAIDCSQGINTTSDRAVEPMSTENAPYVDYAQQIKQSVHVPVITAGRITEASFAENILETGKADIIGMGRASLADPDFPKKVKEGRLDDIRYCIGCVQGCLGENYRGNSCHCLVNPEVDREFEIKKVKPVTKPKKIFIAGAGVAGCEAAIVAAKRGHDITLFEKSTKLGGTWLIAGLPPYKADVLKLTVWQRHALAKYKVKIFFGAELTKETVDQEKPDEVIIATGSTPNLPHLPGSSNIQVVQANDVLQQNERPGENIVVMGGGSVGVETAEYCHWYGSNVSVLEMADHILNDCEKETKLHHKRAIKADPINIITKAKITGLNGNSVEYESQGKVKKIDNIDTLIIAVGSHPVNNLANDLADSATKVVTIGDAKKVRNGLAAVYEGYMAGLNA